ncbi:VPLPA-CTERM sorting domain-containing protein [Sneathiella glossodoripedis]|uniref:VPLPA-CTERM sorting domain-containing protein n=1 Tax=Sneathiella glossodoripedis TaxID=418853 RepID=UPI0004708803|nr:VPLPA-CTERM sorting domain-containing protein [Sneathiella glossodoripedis]
MNSVFKLIIGVFVLTVIGAQSASSATFNLDFNEPLTITPLLSASSTSGTVHEGLTSSDSTSYMYKSPFEGTTTPAEAFTSVQARSEASYKFSDAVTQVSFLWGSVDFFNTVVFKNNGTIVDYLSGQTVIDAGAVSGEEFVQISILALAAFDEIIFRSSQNAFEFANLSISAVPLPAALPLYAAGVVLLALIGRKRSVKGSS